VSLPAGLTLQRGDGDSRTGRHIGGVVGRLLVVVEDFEVINSRNRNVGG
jgi:hypothetical protein